MIKYNIKIEQVKAENRPVNPIVVSVNTTSENPTNDEIKYAEVMKASIRICLDILSSFSSPTEALEGEIIEGQMTDGLKSQLNAMLKRHGVTGKIDDEI